MAIHYLVLTSAMSNCFQIFVLLLYSNLREKDFFTGLMSLSLKQLFLGYLDVESWERESWHVVDILVCKEYCIRIITRLLCTQFLTLTVVVKKKFVSVGKSC